MRFNYRLAAVCFAAIAVNLPMAWISLSKLFLLLAGLFCLVQDVRQQGPASLKPQSLVTWLVLAAVALFAASTLWTQVDTSFAWLAWVKHAKLLEIILITQLLRSHKEALSAVACLLLGHGVVLGLSYLQAAGVPLPSFVVSPFNANIVFAESYIDQGLMTVVFVSLVWHLKGLLKLPTWLAGVLCAAGLVNVLALLPGRTGFVTAAVVLGLAVMWALPKRLQLFALLAAPILVGVLAFATSGKVKEGFNKIYTESQDYAQAGNAASSIGWRLNAWHRSTQAMQDQPLGYGVGSWTPAVKKYQGDNAVQIFGATNASNPHQEYLLWGVELGVLGCVLLLALLLAYLKQTLIADKGVQHAAITALAVVATACLFNSAIYDDLLGDFLCVSLGLLLALCRHTPEQAQPGLNDIAALSP